MDRLQRMVADALHEFKLAAIDIMDEAAYDRFFYKYDAELLGENRNIVESEMLRHSLSHHFDIDLEPGQLNTILPVICDKLGVKCESDKPCDDEENLTGVSYLVYMF